MLKPQGVRGGSYIILTIPTIFKAMYFSNLNLISVKRYKLVASISLSVHNENTQTHHSQIIKTYNARLSDTKV